MTADEKRARGDTYVGYKMYVRVGVEFTEYGDMLPHYVITNDDKRWEITKVKNHQRLASRKAGGCGIRYQVVINNRDASLYFEDAKEKRWFVETKQPAPDEES